MPLNARLNHIVEDSVDCCPDVLRDNKHPQRHALEGAPSQNLPARRGHRPSLSARLWRRRSWDSPLMNNQPRTCFNIGDAS